MAKTQAFERHSDRYDAWFDRNHDFYQAELAAMRQLMPPSTRGLEVGVGSGKFAVPLGIRTGVEPAASMAVKAGRQGIQVVRATAEHLPFAKAVFDLVMMVTTICFVDDILCSFREAARVLRPGGSLLVGFVDRKSALGRQYSRKQNSSVFYRDAVFVSVPEISQYLEAAGFFDLQFRQTLIPENETMVREGFGEGAFVVIQAVTLPAGRQ